MFSGSAIGRVGADGRTILPPFVMDELKSRSSGGRLLLGAHQLDPCLSGYGAAHEVALLAEVERRRLVEEAAGIAPAVHHRRVRRTFGLTEQSAVEEDGSVTLPALARARGRIEGQALFVGAGESFEIWNPQLAKEAAEPELREIAEYRLSELIEREEGR